MKNNFFLHINIKEKEEEEELYYCKELPFEHFTYEIGIFVRTLIYSRVIKTVLIHLIIDETCCFNH